jgi:wyosine [tRNA(Phe)-imidazoG37] synthetase (radical SAM superfamily)
MSVINCTMENSSLFFGPIPSRRLGQSLGINNTLLPKACSYNCAYCQAGRTHHPEISRRAFADPDTLYRQIAAVLAQAAREGTQIDYLSFVPDGEPTLDINLGRSIRLLKSLGKPIAVFTNASLLWRPEVRAELALADWVSLKMDAVSTLDWKKIDRPEKHLPLEDILRGAETFSRQYTGTLVTETMLCHKLNDDDENLRQTADFIATLHPAAAYIGVPTRPPLESWAVAPDEAVITKAFAIFAERIPRVELIIGYPAASFQQGHDLWHEIPAILAVHPMQEADVQAFINHDEAQAEAFRQLVNQGVIVRTAHQGKTFWTLALR